MPETLIHTARSFAEFYGISRERLSRIIALALRERAGVFALAGYGFFRAELVAPRRMEIRPYTATRAEQESTPVYPLKGQLADVSAPSSTSSGSTPSGSTPAPASGSTASADLPSKYELELQVMQERITAMRQKNVLEQARLRDETVSYCSEAVQILLKNLRADIDSISLAPPEAARLRAAIDNALADLAAVLPAIIAGTPADRIELELSARRADRIAASHQAHPQPHPQPQMQPQTQPQSSLAPEPAGPDSAPPAESDLTPPPAPATAPPAVQPQPNLATTA